MKRKKIPSRKKIYPLILGLISSATGFAGNDDPSTLYPGLWGPQNQQQHPSQQQLVVQQQPLQAPAQFQNPFLGMSPMNVAQQRPFDPFAGLQNQAQQQQPTQLGMSSMQNPFGPTQAQQGYPGLQPPNPFLSQTQIPYAPTYQQMPMPQPMVIPADWQPGIPQAQGQQQNGNQGLQPPAQNQAQYQDGVLIPIPLSDPQTLQQQVAFNQAQNQAQGQQIEELVSQPSSQGSQGQQGSQGIQGNGSPKQTGGMKSVARQGLKRTPLINEELPVTGPTITHVDADYDREDYHDTYDDYVREAKDKTKIPDHLPSMGGKKLGHGRYQYLVVGDDEVSGSDFLKVELKIAAQELIWRKESGLPISGDYHKSTVEAFKLIAEGDMRNVLGPYPAMLTNSSPAVKRMRKLIDDSKALEMDAKDARMMEKHPWRYAFGKFIKKRALQKITPETFNADAFSLLLYNLDSDKERLDALQSLYAKIPPLTHPEYLRIIRSFDQSGQWRAHEILSEISKEKLKHPGKLFTHLKDFDNKMVVDWSSRISFEVMADLLRKEHFSSHSLSSSEFVKMLEIIGRGKSEKPHSEKSYLGLRDKMRKFTENWGWTARDLYNMGIDPKVNMLIQVLFMTKDVDSNEIDRVEKAARRIYSLPRHKVEIKEVKEGKTKGSKKGKLMDRGNDAIEFEKISDLIEDQVSRLRERATGVRN